MIQSELSRKFIEAMLRLKRDTINQNELGILQIQGLMLKISDKNNTTINYDLSFGCWIIKSNLNNLNWNPTLKEITDFIENYTEKEILDSIDKLYLLNRQIYQQITGISLFNKVNGILHLFEFEENQKEEIGLTFNTKIGKYYVYYDKNIKTFMFKQFDKNNNEHLSDKGLMLLLENISYFDVITILNETYLRLKRKI